MMRFGHLVMLVIAFCAACGGDAGTSPSPLAPTLVGAYQGTWTGQTSQSERFGFVVTGNEVTRVEFNVSHSNMSCVGALSAGTVGPFASISNAEFSGANTKPSGDLTWSVVGTFVSERKATGTLQVIDAHVTPSGPPCSASVQVTWTAQKSS